MAEVFADLPEALDNTIEIAKRCAFRPKGRKPILPRFVAVAGDVSEAELSRSRRRSCAARPGRVSPSASPPRRCATGFTPDDYDKRLAYELDVISKHEVPRLLPDRRRLHQVGEGAAAFRSVRAAAPAPARSSPGR